MLWRQFDRIRHNLAGSERAGQSGFEMSFERTVIPCPKADRSLEKPDGTVMGMRRIPLASWFRFQRAVEHTRSALLVVSETPCAQTCATLAVKMGQKLSAIRCQLSNTTGRLRGPRT